MTLVPAGELRRFAADSLAGLGIPAVDAAIVAEVLVYADLRGLDAHGVYRLPAYLDRVAAGLAGGTGDCTATGSGAVRRLDAGHALGPAAAASATDLAIGMAREHGIGLVAVGRSTHFGAAGFYALRVAEQELVGLVMSNGPRVVAPFGAVEAFLGTNPLAVGVPLGRHGAFVHDMATGASRAKIRRAADAGEPIEPGLAVDAQGRPTTDAAAALLGSVLPSGGAKGSGLGVTIALLAGMLGGAEFDDEIAPTYGELDRPQDIGHIVVVIDPWRLSPREQTLARTEALVDRMHALRPADGAVRVRFSGEHAAGVAARRAEEGIPVPVAELRRWAQACDRHGLRDGAGWARSRAG